MAAVNRGSREMDVYLNVAGYVKDIRQHRLDQAVTLGKQRRRDPTLIQAGVYIFHPHSPRAKIKTIGWLGKKFDDLIEKTEI